ncbi:MAG: DUF3810 domain-containing protein [Oscillospiraceae bacterium]|nr:DUF3810 domain-containing protein [Oscillospiraceae bacterium]
MKKNIIAIAVTTVILLIVNGLAWLSASAVDFYHLHIYCPMSRLMSRICGIVPFSVGEIMIGLGIGILIVYPILLIVSVIAKKRPLRRVSTVVFCWILVFILMTETLNCFVLYHTTELTTRLSVYKSPDITTDEVVSLCADMILRADALAPVIDRDEKGRPALPADLRAEAERSFSRMTDEFPELYGYCTPPKVLKSSMLMTQFNLQGIYFPFSLEGNYNGELSPARVPCTTFHELCHVKGFIREDEANFLSTVACMESDVPVIRYSGYITSMNYLYGEAARYASEEDIYMLRSLLTEQVAADNTFVSEEYMRQVEEKAVVSTEVMNEVSDTAIDTTLKVNGITDGSASYGRMVTLLVMYDGQMAYRE